MQLQHFAIASKLSNIDDNLFHSIYDCQTEMDNCRLNLNVDGQTTKQLRMAVRDRHFDNWSSLSYAGIGVKHFKTYPKANNFMINKKKLSSSE